jgi:hypothetical protein
MLIRDVFARFGSNALIEKLLDRFDHRFNLERADRAQRSRAAAEKTVREFCFGSAGPTW